MNTSKFGILAGFAVFAASTASAAEPILHLENVQGTVLIQSQGDFVAAFDGDIVTADQQILVKAKSSAIISSDAGPCFFALRNAGLYRLPVAEECVPGQVAVLPGEFNAETANGAKVIPTADAPEMMAPVVGGAVPMLVAGGFLAVTSTAIAVTASTKDKKGTVSAP